MSVQVLCTVVPPSISLVKQALLHHTREGKREGVDSVICPEAY